jgi:site-specific DNA recombinase
MAATTLPGMATAGQAGGGDMLALWAEATGRRRAAGHGLGGLRFAFYGRVSTDDWQDPVTSRARQRDQAAALVAGHGRIVAEFFDTGYSRTLPWARRPQAAALVAALTDPDRGWDAIVIGEYERAFYGGQYASMAPLSEHFGIQPWMPEVGGRIDFHAEDHEEGWESLPVSSWPGAGFRGCSMMRATPAAMAAAASRVCPLTCSPSSHQPRMTATSGLTNA